MKNKAENAIRSLCSRVMSGDAGTWRKIDRIERRFGCVGLADAILEHHERAHAAFLYAEMKRHDAQNPDRLIYLHR